MRALRVTLLGILAAAVAAASAVAAAPKAGNPPIAHAAGGDVTTVIYPAIVNVPLQRATNLLDSAMKYQDTGDDANAVKALTGVQSNLKNVLAGDEFLIKNAPPPVAAAGVKVKPKAKAKANAKTHASGGAVGGVSPYADQFATTSAVLTLQHTIATTALGLTDTASPTVLPVLQATVTAALKSRDDLIAFVHAQPAPPAAAEAGIKVPAHASGGAVVATWDTTMQAVLFDTDDELMQINGLRASASGTSTPTAFLDQVQVQVTNTASTINKFWPPAPAAG
jgi:hypothetical protein